MDDMKRALLLLFILPVLLILYIGATRHGYKESGPELNRNSYPSLLKEQWMGIYFKGRKLGFSHNALFKGEKGFKSTSKAVIRLSSSDSFQETSFNNETFLTRKKKLSSFRFIQEMSGHRQVVDGIKIPGNVEMTITSSGAVNKKTIPWPEGSITANALPDYILNKGLAPGKKYTVNLFIEPIQTVVRLKIAVIGFEDISIAGKTVSACKIKEEFNGLKSYTWITKAGIVVKEVSLEGLISVVEPGEQAVLFQEEPLSVSSLINFSLVRTDREIPDQGKLKQITIKVKGLSEAGIIPEDGRQRIDDQYTDEAGVRTIILTVNKRYREKGSGNQLTEKYLSPTPEIQSDYRDIISRAHQITGLEKDSYKKARLILTWVFNYMKKKPVDTFTAADALHSGEGECQSHTNLFAALARASRIPTRVVSGLVYSERDGGFLYHAWPEIYVGRWIAMDPTFGQEIADPTHIKLSTGGWEQQLNLLKFIGKISIEVIDMS